MMQAKDVVVSVDNFIAAIISSRHVDELELYQEVAKLCNSNINRLAGLDPDRNR